MSALPKIVVLIPVFWKIWAKDMMAIFIRAQQLRRWAIACPQQTRAVKWGGAVPLSVERGLCSHLTQCGLGRGIPPYGTFIVTIQPFGPNTPVCLSVCLSVLYLCLSLVCMDEDETWHPGRPRPRPHCVGWDPAPHTESSTAAPSFEIYGRMLCLRPYNP